jgi:hypothetical protein
MAETKNAILLRVKNTPKFEVVPRHAIALFDRVIEETEVEALAAHPDDVWARVDYWKVEILNRVAAPLRGLVAGQYHEYIAALLRGGDSGVVDDTPPRPSYGGEARAQYDAYMACCASLD